VASAREGDVVPSAAGPLFLGIPPSENKPYKLVMGVGSVKAAGASIVMPLAPVTPRYSEGSGWLPDVVSERQSDNRAGAQSDLRRVPYPVAGVRTRA